VARNEVGTPDPGRPGPPFVAEANVVSKSSTFACEDTGARSSLGKMLRSWRAPHSPSYPPRPHPFSRGWGLLRSCGSATPIGIDASPFSQVGDRFRLRPEPISRESSLTTQTPNPVRYGELPVSFTLAISVIITVVALATSVGSIWAALKGGGMRGPSAGR
jgi:hypothetical protein